MSAIRCHFDGKVIVPDEPVDLPINRPLVIRVEGGVAFMKPSAGSGTVADIIESGAIGSWKHRTDISDSTEFIREQRRLARIARQEGNQP